MRAGTHPRRGARHPRWSRRSTRRSFTPATRWWEVASARLSAPRFKAEGTKFVRDVWESASISAFDDSDGSHADEALQPRPRAAHPRRERRLQRAPGRDGQARRVDCQEIGPRDCVWVGPPLWKGDKGLVEVIRTHAAPCRFFDSQHLVLQRAGDGIHPTEKGGRPGPMRSGFSSSDRSTPNPDSGSDRRAPLDEGRVVQEPRSTDPPQGTVTLRSWPALPMRTT